MTTLKTFHVDDWADFIRANDIDLTCPMCRGDKENCDDCSGVGYMTPMWNTIWNTGYQNGAQHVPAHLGDVFAFDWDGEIWFGLLGCGMDLTPCLAWAWIEMFPKCQWLPEQFIVSGGNLRGGYVEACIGKTKARRVYALIGKTIRSMRYEARSLADDLKEARNHLKKASA
jgi:hypothetical protein